MATRCPKCDTENPTDSKFCKECAAPLKPTEVSSVAFTKTLETPIEMLKRGILFAERYEIIEELGKGGMGTVFRVEDKKVGQEIALKLIKSEVASDRHTIERFRNELKTTRMISHRNVCRMFDLSESDGTHFITMEYVPGEDLKSLIRRVGRLDAGTGIRIAKQVCEGLSEAHRLGVVHRDLKPSNIMIDKEGNARIMDFGIARSIKARGLTGEGIIIGTPEYMSPEQVEAKDVDQRSDIYSLGAVLYEMVTGQLPFEGDTPLSVAMKHKSEPPKDPRERNTLISEELSQLILKCLEKDKELRFQSSDELLDVLIHIEKGIPATQRIDTKKKPLTSKEITVTFGLRKVLVPLIIVVMVAITAVVIWRLLPKGETPLAPKIENSLAVITFENQTGDVAFDYLQKAIPNLLITNLEQTGYFYVATWERMFDLIRQMGKGDVDIIDRELGFDICRKEGIEAIVLGSVVKAGETFVTDVKVLDVETRKLIKSANARGEGIDSILNLQIDELTKEIARSRGIPRQNIEASDSRISDFTTTSMEAYNHFLMGRDSYERRYYDEARQFLEKAVEIDPTFAIAYHQLGHAYNDLRLVQASMDAFENAKTHSTKASEKERLVINAGYALYVENDRDKWFRFISEIASKYPKEKRVHYLLGGYYSIKKMFPEAISEFNIALELDPNYGSAFNGLAFAYSRAEDYEKAIEYYMKYAVISPEDANPFDSMGELYTKLGRLDEAIAQFRKALEIKPDFGSEYKIAYIYAIRGDYSEALNWVDRFIAAAPSPGLQAQGHLWRSFYHAFLGQLNQSLDEIKQSDQKVESVGNKYAIAVGNITRGMIYLDYGEHELSFRHSKAYFDFMMKFDPQRPQFNKNDFNLYSGLNDAQSGKIESAKLKFEEAKTLLQESINQSPLYGIIQKRMLAQLHAEILLAEGSPSGAIEVLENIPDPAASSMSIQFLFRLNMPFNQNILARAYVKNGDLDKAIAEYENLINFDPDNTDRRIVHPKYHYKLAKLYEQKTWEGKAIEHYEKFLELWKDADEGIPELEDAEKRLTGLKSE
jgi:serine/threonine protein kinase/Tfp pilus assembly protein PilF